MKKLILMAVMVTGLFLIAPSASNAVTPSALDGNDYRVTAFCRNAAGDYCNQREFIQDTFTFTTDGDFIVDSFNNGVLGLGDSGSFNENGLSFTASYEVITDSSLDKYTFDVTGMNLFDIILIGRMDIAFYTLSITGYGNPQDETQAFFFGIKK